jgi:hypothetical protein
MSVVETQLKITAQQHVANAFREIAQANEMMTQRVTKSQRLLVDSHKTAVQQMAANAAEGYTTLSRLAGTVGIGLGATALVEGVKKSVQLFANVDQQARALHVSTGASLEKINDAYERLDKVAASARVPVEELRNAFDTLARRFTLGGAESMLTGVAQAAAGMHVNAEEVANFNTQLVKTLGFAQKDVPAAFDSLVGAARGGGVTAKELEGGLSEVSRDMADIGMTGPKALHEVEAAMESVGEVTKNSTTAIEGVKGVLDAINTKRLNKALLEQANIYLPYQLHLGALAGKSPLEVAIEQSHKAALIIQRRDRGTIEEAYAKLSKNPAIRQTLQELYRNKDVTAQVQDRISESGGAMAEAASTMTEGASGSLQSFSNKMIEAGEAVGSFTDHVWRGIERLGGGVDRLTGSGAGAGAHGAPERDIHGEPIPGKFKPISGEVGDIGWLGGRPLIPSEPGSSTERTAREQLEALRRLERAAMWGGGLGGGGGSSGASGGGESPSSRGGGVSPSGGGGRGGSTPGGSGGGSTPGGDSGGGGGGKGHGAYNTQKAFDLIKQAGGTDEEARTLAAISQAESAGNPRSHNTKGRDNSYGLWQINMLGGMGPERRRKFGLKSNEDLFNPATNARVALAMHRGARGYRDWSTYTSGAYKKYLGGARSSVAKNLHPIAGDLSDFNDFVAAVEKKHSSTPSSGPVAHTPSSQPFPHDKNYALSTMTPGKRRPDEFITGGPGVHYDQDPNMPVVRDDPTAGVKEKLNYEKMQKYIDHNPLRMKVAYDAADVRTHSRSYARRSFAKEARDTRYQSYTDMGTPA